MEALTTAVGDISASFSYQVEVEEDALLPGQTVSGSPNAVNKKRG